MGKEQMEEHQEEKDQKELAELLGITYEEIQELDYEINEETSNDGAVLNHYIKFKENSSKEILKKIKGLDDNNTLYLPPGSFGE